MPTDADAADLAAAATPSRFVVPLADLSLADLPRVGGKNASLGEMLRELATQGVRVPGGFATTVEAFSLHLGGAELTGWIHEQLDPLDTLDVRALAAIGRKIRDRIVAAPLPDEVAREIAAAYRALGTASRQKAPPVAVRSSATAEDLPGASFAGQHDTYLNIRGERALLDAVRACMASLFTDRAIAYRVENGIPHRGVGLSVGVQRMVRSDRGGAGVIFTIDTESGFPGVVLLHAAWGLGESVVQGRTSPDEYLVHKATAAAGFTSIIRRRLGEKRRKLVYARGGGAALREAAVSKADRGRFVLADDEVMQLANWGVAIERHYSRLAGTPRPMDIEWAKDGLSGQLFILQARAETVHAQRRAPLVEFPSLRERSEVIVRGSAVGNRIGSGRVRVVHSATDLPRFEPGEVLVAEMTDPDWEPVIRKAAAVVTDHGGRTCHAAIVSREMGIPCVVGCGDATARLACGQEVTVCCAEGSEGRVYAGILAASIRTVDPAALPTPRVPLMLNLADPGRAFELSALPAAGVGLMRIEFVIAREIGIHPMALLEPDRVTSVKERREIAARTRGFDPPAAFFIERLAEGVARIAAAFHPRPVLVRFSDFKSNEYAGLLGGAAFEPQESNPMIGFRGAARYIDDRYRAGFALECAAIRRVRESMGLANVKVMIPFCRTVREADAVLAELAHHGLHRGEDGLEVWVMCEIPSNAILAEQFAYRFDGFSIGSNDLTQLTLGIDRDSELLQASFDERDAAVLAMIEMTIVRAHAKGRPVGICGEAPSNHPEFATWLADLGIDSISLNPDALPECAERLAAPTAPTAPTDPTDPV